MIDATNVARGLDIGGDDIEVRGLVGQQRAGRRASRRRAPERHRRQLHRHQRRRHRRAAQRLVRRRRRRRRQRDRRPGARGPQRDLRQRRSAASSSTAAAATWSRATTSAPTRRAPPASAAAASCSSRRATTVQRQPDLVPLRGRPRRATTTTRCRATSIGTDVSGNAALGEPPRHPRRRRRRQPDRRSGRRRGQPRVRQQLAGVRLNADGADPAEDNDVQGNLIGTDVTGTAPLAERHRRRRSSTSRQHDRRHRAGAGNVISGNVATACGSSPTAPTTTTCRELDRHRRGRARDLGNGESGVDIVDGDAEPRRRRRAAQRANTIAYNGEDGVTVTARHGNAIVRNSIHDNGDLGIDLDANGPTANDGARPRHGREHAPERPR